MNKTLFNTLLHPIEAIIASISPIIDQESNSQKLFFADFVRKLIFGYVYQTSSLRNLTVELKTNPVCQALGFEATPFSTLKDGFYRFESRHFKKLFERLLEQTSLSKVPYLDEIGPFRVIDGRQVSDSFIRQIARNSLDSQCRMLRLFTSLPINPKKIIQVKYLPETNKVVIIGVKAV